MLGLILTVCFCLFILAGRRKWPEIYRIGANILVTWYLIFGALAAIFWFSAVGVGSTTLGYLFGPLAGGYATGLSAGAVFLKGGGTIMQIIGAISMRYGLNRHGKKPNIGYAWRPRWVWMGLTLLLLSILLTILHVF